MRRAVKKRSAFIKCGKFGIRGSVSLLRALPSASSSPPAPCLPRSYVRLTDSSASKASELARGALHVRQMTVALTANASADNICNCYERPAAPKLLTIARLSNIAFIGHACVSLLIYVPLGLVIFSLVLQGGDSDRLCDSCLAVLLAVAIFLGLIAVSRVATAFTRRADQEQLLHSLLMRLNCVAGT
jgi:hypothetical protein